MNTFSELGLEPRLVDALNDLGIVKPTQIQQEAIPILLDSMQDFIGLAQTGTGKTAAFGLPLLQVVNEDSNTCQAIVLAPTRELAQQIAEGLNSFAKNIRKLKIEVVFGGAAITNQIKALKAKPQIVVATPGRLVDLINRKVISMSSLSYVVLDEADEMLNMGFKEELNKILADTPAEKTTWLFSATMPSAITNIVSTYMNNPKEVSVKSGVEVNKNISHQYLVVKMSDKLEAIKRVLDVNPNFYGVMFCRTKIDTQNLADDISRAGYRAEALHGDLTQKQRDAVMRKFKDRSLSMLVATDVAARGIDVNDVTHVIHHRLPDELEFYTHRSGRTARAGKKGISIALVSKGEVRRIGDIERRLKIKFEKELIPTADEVMSSRMDNSLKLIADYEIKGELPADLRKQAQEMFTALSKEELVDKLLAQELSKVNISNSGDLNQTENSRSKEGGRERSSGTHARLFINLGKIDDISNAELLHMICDISGADKSKIGKIELQQKRAYFEVEKSIANDVMGKFKGYEFEGREIRVNEEEQSSRSGHAQQRGYQDRKRRGSGGGGSGRSGRSGGSGRSNSGGGRSGRSGGRRR
ncbi:DEAD/DEAH box helicase [Reichenbachiella carrageenanivorans]|uniref:RNA helicase n=1 Tax=Reichenbachiella carrageenanivorans TaxID=2979869 RepID=A0ABY6CZH9_9BACT|nr:DEAD/DEAH box helicase [Reichenbachiella carrageenanivorans]UXX78223.1 DEAD/DEAH box helicase [Reichenbachiella carrageenanivorans]